MKSDHFSIISIQRLAHWLREEEKRERLFGISRRLFYKPSASDPFRMTRYGQLLETPLGVAAGPHTQMTQNIVSAWLTGARYMELKTVQTLDELTVSKPCIDLEDEGYNCEWSQELKLKQSYDQYLNAWILIHVLRRRLGFDQNETGNITGGPGFMFNLSVGYNMEGILKDNVQWFLEKMENCAAEKEEKLNAIEKIFPEIKEIDIPDRMSDNITLSTMHGCPPEEIETIARYLLEKRKYHTAVKLNPTLLGPDVLREILNNKLGFGTDVPDEAFGHDLKYRDAVALISSLREAAKESGVDFGLKLTNTLESVNNRDVFSPGEKMMYMSGRALHPLAISLAAKLQNEFNGQLDISFSAGADAFNLPEIIAAGLKPVTVCSDVLKPGGYGRLSQYLEILGREMKETGAASIEEFIRTKASNEENKSNKEIKEAALQNLNEYAGNVTANKAYSKDSHAGHAIKTERPLGLFDCIGAPCQTTCPAHQGVPEYMYHTAQGDYRAAMDMILRTNPFPSVTGMVCDHACTSRCTRMNMDNALDIRGIKRFIEEQVRDLPPLTPEPETGISAGIIGAGPSGLACAFYLALTGVDVDVYETRDIPGGMVSNAIPAFRLKEEDIWRDIRRIEDLGVSFHYNYTVDKKTFNALRKEHDYIYIGVGAQKSTRLNIDGEELPGVTDALSFLGKVRRGERVTPGRRVAVIGGGNSAMDAARTAWRIQLEKDAKVTILYRRTRAQMPADPEEIRAVLDEGIEIQNLTAPVKVSQNKENLTLTCWKMRLGEKDDSGRRRPVKIENSDFDLEFDTIISAIGQQVDWNFLDEPLNPDPATGKTSLENTFAGGDALHGALNIITAAADGRQAANNILSAAGKPLEKAIEYRFDAMEQRQLTPADYELKAARRVFGRHPGELEIDKRKNFEIVTQTFTPEKAIEETSRCLLCGDVCNVCVTVCPNRANISYALSAGKPVEYRLQRLAKRGDTVEIEDGGVFLVAQRFQAANIADFCNECGNCHTFCPTAGSPYKDKPKICLTQESYESEPNGFLAGKKEGCRFLTTRRNGFEETLTRKANGPGISFIYETRDISITFSETLEILEKTIKSGAFTGTSLAPAAEMAVLLEHLPWEIYQ